MKGEKKKNTSPPMDQLLLVRVERIFFSKTRIAYMSALFDDHTFGATAAQSRLASIRLRAYLPLR